MMSETIKYRSAETGEYVTEDYAAENPTTTVSEVYENEVQVAQQTGYLPSLGKFPGVTFAKETDVVNESRAVGGPAVMDDLSIRIRALDYAQSVSANGSDLLSNAKKVEAYLRGQG